mmetsp:Transcript_25937/g.49693  ORF Transcript_25937/g.49693 Transcript_25937/m.49693 type:complete len:112 (-) Transcript_25937:45-380(-)
MAFRSKSGFLPLVISVAAVTALVFIHDVCCFITAGSIAASTLGASTAALAPSAAQMTALSPEAIDVGSSVNVATLTEGLICGIVMGLFPFTILGLLVSAWLQWKKGPTLGL